MTDVVLFHHAHGLTDGVRAFAEQLRGAGHRVTLPDLYDGATFDSLDDGVGHARQIGFETIIERGRLAAEGLPNEIVYAGFSLGGMPAQMLAQTRPGAKGALLFHSCVPASEFGGPWPQDVPLQIHAMDADPWFVTEGDIEAARDLVETIEDAELFLYPGSCTPAINTCSLTKVCRPTTRAPRPCSGNACSTSSAGSSSSHRHPSRERKLDPQRCKTSGEPNLCLAPGRLHSSLIARQSQSRLDRGADVNWLPGWDRAPAKSCFMGPAVV